jgi:hypothetical protein
VSELPAVRIHLDAVARAAHGRAIAIRVADLLGAAR